MQGLAGLSVLRDGFLVPVQDSSLPLLRSPVSLQRSGCACLGLRPCGKCLRLCLRKVPQNCPRSMVLAFHSSLSLVEGSSDGLAAGDLFISPGQWCLTRSVHVELSRVCAVSLWGLAFLAPLGLTVAYCRIQWRRSSRKLLRFPCGFGLPVLSLDCVLLTSSLSSPGCSHPGLSWLPLMGFDFAGLVVWFLLAPRSLEPPSCSTPFSCFVTFWRFVRCELGSPLVPSLLVALLG